MALHDHIICNVVKLEMTFLKRLQSFMHVLRMEPISTFNSLTLSAVSAPHTEPRGSSVALLALHACVTRVCHSRLRGRLHACEAMP